MSFMWKALMLSAGIVFPTAAATVTITVHPDHPGIAIPRDFLGFSFEAGTLTSARTFAAENPAFQRVSYLASASTP
jgi:hypothetical protein